MTEQGKIINSFPEYEYRIDEMGNGHNWYRGIEIGKGGYIVSNPGIYVNVALLDIQSMHPSSIIALNYFGDKTKEYAKILRIRLLIKHKQFEEAKKLLPPEVGNLLDDPAMAKALSDAYKIFLNSSYGVTYTKHLNPFRDPRNKNNIIALRGALFIKTLQDEIEARGFDIVSCKTDSIKIANATDDIIDFTINFAKQYGYTFEYEARYDRICAINDADYIAYGAADSAEHANEWTATGARFQHPYVFKTLFLNEEPEFDDMCEIKSVSKGALYLGVLTKEARLKDPKTITADDISEYVFVGKVGQFTPVKPKDGGNILFVKRENTEKYDAVQGTKGYFWMESGILRSQHKENLVDLDFYRDTNREAIKQIEKYGDFDRFIDISKPYSQVTKEQALAELEHPKDSDEDEQPSFISDVPKSDPLPDGWDNILDINDPSLPF